MTTRQTITVGRQRFRVGPWHADATVAQLLVGTSVTRPSTDDLLSMLAQVTAAGYNRVLTSAIDRREAALYLDAGFVEEDRLRVLQHDLAEIVAPPNAARFQLRRGRRRDRSTALAIDASAFPLAWRLDEPGLLDAETATPTSRFRMALFNGVPAGYAVTGRGAHQGFLQRLATAPQFGRQGVATALIEDGLLWCRRRNCRRVFVNTQASNDAALGLYDKIGFHDTGNDLVVLSRMIP